MRYVILALAVLFAFPVSVPANAEELTAESEITAVTVYTNRATVTRTAEIEAPQGAHTVVFEDLPLGLMTDSLRVEGSARANVIFGAISHNRVNQADLANPREDALQKQIETLEQNKKLVQSEEKSWQDQIRFLREIGKQATDRVNEKIAEDLTMNPQAWLESAQTVRQGVEEALKAGVALEEKIADIDEQIRALQNELNEIRTGARSFYRVEIPVEAERATSLTVQLSYQIGGATWTPVYDARLDTRSGELELVQYGAVRQRTGEDWEDVALSLSTAQPHRGAGLPDLNPWWVSAYNNSKKLNAVGFMGGGLSETVMVERRAAADMAAAPQAMELEEARPANMRAAQIDAGGFVSEYRIPGPSSVLADGSESKLLIGGFDNDTELEVQIKPQLSTDAFLVAKTTITGEAPLLPGKVNLFRDGAYVGVTHAPLLRPGEETDLAFGIDDQIAVTRNTVKDERSEAGVISRDHVLERHFVTEIKNLRGNPVKIAVLENTPVSKNEKINVEILEKTTTSGFEKGVDNKAGVLRWGFDLGAGAEKTVSLGWKVSWPKDMNISGL